MIDTKPFVKTMDGKPLAVYGLGLSGFATAKALQKAGAQVFAWDEDEEKRLKAAEAGIELSHFEETDLKGYGALVLSPGVPLYYPAPPGVVGLAREEGIPILGDIEILHRCETSRQTIAITGTNGKSTTTALIAHILQAAKIDAVIGGNIGKPVLDLKMPAKDGVFVLEMSSYQIDLCPAFRPDFAVLLNLSPDHLDRHGTMEKYAAAKERLFEGNGVAVCGIDDDFSLSIYDRAVKAGFRRMIPVSVKKEISGGAYVKDGKLFDSMTESHVEIGNVSDLQHLRGAHNHQNICAAYAVCKSMGMNGAEIYDHIRMFPGLAHRQFLTRVINGIAYVNDSKATNMDAVSKALACYNNIYLIAGGRAKDGGLSGIESFSERIRHVFLIGEALEEFSRQLDKIGIAHTKCFSLDVAVLDAHTMAQGERGQPGGAGTVLLSPACASWDQFKNFEHRGDVFSELVNALSEETRP